MTGLRSRKPPLEKPDSYVANLFAYGKTYGTKKYGSYAPLVTYKFKGYNEHGDNDIIEVCLTVGARHTVLDLWSNYRLTLEEL